MNLQPVNPPMRQGQRVVCVRCSRMTAYPVADLDDKAGTFYCPECLQDALVRLRAARQPSQDAPGDER